MLVLGLLKLLCSNSRLVICCSRCELYWCWVSFILQQIMVVLEWMQIFVQWWICVSEMLDICMIWFQFCVIMFLCSVFRFIVCFDRKLWLSMCLFCVLCLNIIFIMFLIRVRLLLMWICMNLLVILVELSVVICIMFCGLVKWISVCLGIGLIVMIGMLCLCVLIRLFIIRGELVLVFWLIMKIVLVCLKFCSMMVFLFILMVGGRLWLVGLWYMFEQFGKLLVLNLCMKIEYRNVVLLGVCLEVQNLVWCGLFSVCRWWLISVKVLFQLYGIQWLVVVLQCIGLVSWFCIFSQQLVCVISLVMVCWVNNLWLVWNFVVFQVSVFVLFLQNFSFLCLLVLGNVQLGYLKLLGWFIVSSVFDFLLIIFCCSSILVVVLVVFQFLVGWLQGL